ncbi:MAG: MmgE/PrpD family protein [Chloroflexi bacterium]|nr:MmgE/PrpD family protein [Chloroflexota bacterium]MDA1218355.1 MmgE/PrpD family protein [Chloroflexota bacterium]
MGATKTLAQFIVDTSYEKLPAPVVAAAKVAILDGIANMLAGSTQELATIIGRYVQQSGGTPQSTVIGWGFKTNAQSAAFANGVFGHCLDYEVQGFPPTHGTSSCLPAALALGEIRNASGKTIIEAYTLGWEIQGRLRAASAAASNPAFHPPGIVGPLGGAAASAKVLGLDTLQTQMALGIAASRTGGLTANTGTMVKSTHPGNAARMGAEAGILAEMGYTSSEEVLEAANGYAAALFQGNLDWDILTQNLGSPYRLVDPGFDIKRYPAQVYMQNPIEAVLNLRQKYNLTPDMVENLTIHRQGRGHSGPIPQSGLDGKFSVEYCAAVALLDGRVVIDSFTDQRRFSPDLEQMLNKIQVDPMEQEPGVVKVTARLTDGRTVSDECRGFKGSAGNPMSRDQRMDKVWDCIGRALPKQDAQQVIDLVEDLENVPDISTLMQIMGQKSPVGA